MNRIVSVLSTDNNTSLVRLAFLLAAPVAIAIAAWIYLAIMIGDMSYIPGMSSVMTNLTISSKQLFGLFLMWSVMMAAMMLPTALPMVLAYSRMQAADRKQGESWLPVFLFSGGYILAWTGFSLVASVIQAGLIHLAVLSPMMMKTVSIPITGGILILAGAYQFTPLKQSCLRQCGTPISFFMTQWRAGNLGALIMGTRHGLFCIGCCWALMGILFVAGVMNTVWIILIMFYVLVEKIIPCRMILSKFAGVCMLGIGFWIIL